MSLSEDWNELHRLRKELGELQEKKAKLELRKRFSLTKNDGDNLNDNGKGLLDLTQQSRWPNSDLSRFLSKSEDNNADDNKNGANSSQTQVYWKAEEAEAWRRILSHWVRIM